VSADDGHLRASDADRERAVGELRAHHDAGRLSIEELEQRLARAYAAVTWGELSALFTDLPGRTPTRSAYAATPAPAPPAAVAPPAVDASGPGGFTYATTVRGTPDAVLQSTAQHLSHELQACRYELTQHLPHRLTFTRSRIPAWAWFVAVLFPGPGFLAPILAAREQVHLHLDVRAQPDGATALVVHGVAPRRIRRALAAFAP
jgi:hypothetical protein